MAKGGDKKPVDLEAARRIREKVLQRVAEENDEDPPRGPSGGDEDVVDSRFVRECLWANAFGDACLFKRLMNGRLIFNKAADRWMRWTGHHWEIDYMDTALSAVEEVVKKYGEEAALLHDEIGKAGDDDPSVARLIKLKKALTERMFALRDRTRRLNCLHFAHTTDDPLAIRGDEIDQKPWLLACKNGVVDLRTGELAESRRDDYLLSAAPVEWKGFDAPCPVWERFLHEIFEENGELVAFVRRFLGSAIVGKTSEHVFVVFIGRGRNGKGTIVEILSNILGGLAGPIRSEMLLDQGFVRNSAGPSPDIMGLRGLRIAFADETDEKVRVSTAKVKWLTGGGELKGRLPNDKFEVVFKPTHALILLSNSLPSAPHNDYAFWERTLVVPFNLSFVRRRPVEAFEREADIALPEKLTAEASGVLSWLVRGCLEWQREGLNPPPIVREAGRQYRDLQDDLGDFLYECLDVGDEFAEPVRASVLYQVFSEYWEEAVGKKKVPSSKWFGAQMRARFRFEKRGVYVYFGLRVKPERVEKMKGELFAPR